VPRTLEVRRHAATEKGERRGRGSHLSQAGITAARNLGDTIGPFAFVVTSDVPRTLETALAMGFAVDDCVDMGGPHFEAASREIAHHQWWETPDPFALWKEYIAEDGAIAALARYQEALWRNAVGRVTQGGAALVISHGGLIEPGLIACVPNSDHCAWGRPFENLEGVRLQIEDSVWVAVELLRVESI
jgi:broad specificity phosphatase PhoE